jgi:ferritin-like metal-binding protein YciE
MDQINKLYCAQTHLKERLSEIVDHPDLQDLREEILATINKISGQIADTDEIYKLLNSKHTFEKCTNQLAVLEDEFDVVQKNVQDCRLRDIALLAYLESIQHMIRSAYQMIDLRKVNLKQTIELIISKNSIIAPGEQLKQLLLDRLHV